MRWPLIALLVVSSSSSEMFAQRVHPQNGPPVDLSEVALRATVKVHTRQGTTAGWLMDVGARPLVVTTRRLIGRSGRVRIEYYAPDARQPERVNGRVVYTSTDLDVAFIRPGARPPERAHALRLTEGPFDISRPLVVAGHGPERSFQTAPARVVDILAPSRLTDPCGRLKCIALRGERFGGGGPAIDPDGNVTGMTWPGPASARAGHPRWVTAPEGPLLIHASTIAAEIVRLASGN